MDVLPLAVPAVPDARLLGLHGAGQAVGVHVLGEADVGHARCVLADQVHVGVEQDGVDRLVALRQSWGQSKGGDERFYPHEAKVCERCVQNTRFLHQHLPAPTAKASNALSSVFLSTTMQCVGVTSMCGFKLK